ncbi:MAG TPA: hypothetical protein VGU71_06520 [Candidatus Dormibacteraeota bacterium]|nr:hypothetical protein [Candidatus Dormibacteraeota bacterium]
MTTDDPMESARSVKQTDALLREARGVLRRLDKLAQGISNQEAPLPHLVAEAREAIDSAVHHLTLQKHTLEQRTKEAIRRR